MEHGRRAAGGGRVAGGGRLPRAGDGWLTKKQTGDV